MAITVCRHGRPYHRRRKTKRNETKRNERTYVRTYVAVPRVVGENILDVFLAVPRVVGENILGVFLAVPRVVGKNILGFFFFDFGNTIPTGTNTNVYERTSLKDPKRSYVRP